MDVDCPTVGGMTIDPGLSTDPNTFAPVAPVNLVDPAFGDILCIGNEPSGEIKVCVGKDLGGFEGLAEPDRGAFA